MFMNSLSDQHPAVQALYIFGASCASGKEGRLLLRLTQGSDSFREILTETRGVSRASHKRSLLQLNAQSWRLLHISAAPQFSLLKFDSSLLGQADLSEALSALDGQSVAHCMANLA